MELGRVGKVSKEKGCSGASRGAQALSEQDRAECTIPMVIALIYQSPPTNPRHRRESFNRALAWASIVPWCGLQLGRAIGELSGCGRFLRHCAVSPQGTVGTLRPLNRSSALTGV